MSVAEAFRRTTQELLPARPEPVEGYDIHPTHPMRPGAIAIGHDALADRLAGASRVVIDGFGGVLWEEFRGRLDAALTDRGRTVAWHDVSAALRPAADIDAIVEPFLGGDDPLFGTRFTGTLGDFFDPAALEGMRPDPAADLSIVYGTGAALAGWDALIVYLDVPKNEIQFRARAGAVRNLGAAIATDHRSTYKRCYFVDWPALTAHRADLLERIDVIVDEQRPEEPAHATGADVREALDRLAHGVFRPRPWFEPGPWGGQWMKRRFAQLPQDVPNYAWSFEFISPENGLLLESDGAVLEVSFDTLMAGGHRAVLGESADRFGQAFPIRFDFLDTVDGGNLSIQVHPRPEYIRRSFGEAFTQDETYYILDCEPDAEVYLGLTEDADPAAFRAELERSVAETAPADIDRFVQRHPASRHDLFLIPSGTVHSSARGNLVLEISATPYIFTFKLYDWMRLDLEGRPRPLNIDRAFENLQTDRRGERIRREFISQPSEIASGESWRLLHLPTHEEHFYDVHRLEFTGAGSVELPTDDSCQVLSLVEGDEVVVEAGGMSRAVRYAETFVVPAAAGSFTLHSAQPAKVLTAFIKKGRGPE